MLSTRSARNRPVPPTPPIDPVADHRDDLECVARARRGDPDAVHELAQRMRLIPRLLAVLNARRGRPLGAADLEDAGQEALLKIWQKLDTYRGAGRLESWLHGFVHYEFMNRLRKQGSGARRAAVDPEELAAETPPAAVPREELYAALEQLPEPEAEAVRLRHCEELGFDSIARTTGTSVSASKSRYYRGLQRLRERLGSKLGEGRG